MLSAYTLDAWSQVYPQLKLADILTPIAQPIVRRIAGICLDEQASVLAPRSSSTALKVSYLRADPWDIEPWKSLINLNTPGHARIPAPVLITQGEADAVIAPSITAAFAKRLCSERETVDYRTYARVTHVGVGADTAAFVAHWIADRFAGKRAPTSCGG